jgi:CrcB protein
MNLLSKEICVVAIGGAFGSVCRLLLSRWVQILLPYENLPWGIIIVNVLGCFLIGIIYGIFECKMLISPVWRAGLMIGILGGFTTFSSFSLDTVHFLLKGETFLAISNILISVAVCLFATLFGVWSTTLFIAKAL